MTLNHHSTHLISKRCDFPMHGEMPAHGGCIACGGRGFVSTTLPRATCSELREMAAAIAGELGERIFVERYPFSEVK